MRVAETRNSYIVYPFRSNFSQISVYKKRYGIDGEIDYSTVNWPAIGSIPPTQTERFARALLYAAHLAEKENSKRLPRRKGDT